MKAQAVERSLMMSCRFQARGNVAPNQEASNKPVFLIGKPSVISPPSSKAQMPNVAFSFRSRG